MTTKPCCPPIVPPAYPYNRPAQDSYTFCVCGKVPPGVPPFPEFPTNGPFKGNGFALNDANPYIIDMTYTKYGQVICYSESVYTKITQRRDPSCINLAATFNLTDTNLSNTVRTDFLEKYIGRKYGVLDGVLPIIKTSLKFKVYYTVTDSMGGLEHEGVAVTTVLDNNFHFTDIRDMFVQSARGVIIENIPAMTYQGLYTLTIDRVECYVQVIDTKEHLVDAMNPFYAFRDNNMTIAMQHETIETQAPDEEILIADCDVHKSFDYQANITNRLRMTFVAFTSMPIAVGSTAGIWEALNEPTEEIITQLRNEVSACEDEIKQLHEIIENQNIIIQGLNGQIELNKNNIIAMNQQIQNLIADGQSYDARLDDHEARITRLENIPLATVRYTKDFNFTTGQLTWNTYGQLYQTTVAFTANGNFESEIAAGRIVPLTQNAEDLSALIERVGEVEEMAESADSLANETAERVDDLADEMAVLIEGKGKVVIKNLETGEYQFTNSYGAAANVIREDLEGEYSIFPGDEYSQQTIAADTFKDLTCLKAISFPESITTINETAFDGCDGINIYIPKEEDSVTGAPWGATNAIISWLNTD